MSKLSDELKMLSLETGCSNSALAHRAGIDRPTFLHFLTGRRRPTPDNLEAILLAVQATPAQRHTVQLLYNEELVDPGLRRQREAVAKLLQYVFDAQEYHNKPIPLLLKDKTGQKQTTHQVTSLNGTASIRAALEQELLEYSRNPLGALMLPPSFNGMWLAVMIDILIATGCRGEIMQLSVFLKRTPNHEEAIRNIETLADSLPLTYLSNMKYNGRFAYAVSTEQVPGAIFHQYILFPQTLFLISRNNKKGWIVRDEDTVQAVQKVFADDYNEAKDCMHVDVNYAEGVQARVTISSEMDKLKKRTWNMRREPQLVNLLDEEMIHRNLRLSPEKQPELYALLLNRVREIAELPLTCYFSRDGMVDFLQTGRLNEIPQELYNPLTVEQRLILLDRLIARIDSDECTDRLLKPRWVEPPLGFYMTVVENYGINFYQQINPYGGESGRHCLFSEPGTAEAFYDFMRNLPQIGYAYNKEETLDQLRRMREIVADM